MTPLAEAIVDVDAISRNVRVLAAHRPGVTVMAVVKADGFGHGAVTAARAAIAGGASWLGVTRLHEAIELRDAGITAPILAWLYETGDVATVAADTDVDLSVSSLDELALIARSGSRVRVHIKLDTGLHRGGVAREHWETVLHAASGFETEGSVSVRGIWSHLSHAYLPEDDHNGKQLDALREGVALARQAGLSPEFMHVANSAGTVGLDAPDLNLVRIGAGMYGIDELGIGLEPAMRLTARLVQARRIPAGDGVSYGHDWIAPRETNVGLVPIGYADGIPRITGNRAQVFCRGRLMPVVGRVAMDQFVIDAGDDPIEPGDEVVVFGPGTQGEPTAAQWADWSETISHEIYCGIGNRIPRVPVRAGALR